MLNAEFLDEPIIISRILLNARTKNIGVLVELRMPSWWTRGSIESLVFNFRLLPIKIEPVTKLLRVARFVKLVQKGMKIFRKRSRSLNKRELNQKSWPNRVACMWKRLFCKGFYLSSEDPVHDNMYRKEQGKDKHLKIEWPCLKLLITSHF